MKKIIIFYLLIFAGIVSAQDIVNTLAASGIFSIVSSSGTHFTLKQSTGLVGIGTNATDPKAQLEIGGTDGLLVRGTVNSGTVRALGAGLRMHWYPRKGAFRVGMAETTYWDDDGSATPKLALYSIAMGYQPRATGVATTAIGAYNQATGDYSLSLGSYCQATQSHAIAIGTQAYATGIYSIAIGSGANTNGKDGSMVIGDDAYFQTAYAAEDNQLTMRFIGGYRLWTSYPDSTAGAYMRHGANAWSYYCDRNLKENFEVIDDEWILNQIRSMPITKWNYKKGNTKAKYIGPVAQDFYKAFQLGGTDSLGINTLCIEGVSIAGVKALEKRTSEMKVTMQKIIEQNEKLISENEKLREQLSSVSKVSDELLELRKLKAELQEQLKIVKAKNGNDKVVLIPVDLKN